MKDLIRKFPEDIKIHGRTVRAWLLSRGLRRGGQFSQPEEEIRAAAAISVIVAVHDSPEETCRCLISLERFGKGAEIIIVDDGSKLTGMPELLGEFASRNGWKLIRNPQPTGHSHASEAGVSLSTRPFVCLLNSDTVVTPYSWAAVVRAFESSEEIAVAGPMTSYTVGPQQILEACHCRHFWSDAQIWSFAEKYVTAHRKDPLVDASFIGGFAFFVRRHVWNEMKGFDHNLPDYGNETEFCVRAKKLGLRLVFTRAGYIHHLGQVSYGRVLDREVLRERGLSTLSYIESKHLGA